MCVSLSLSLPPPPPPAPSLPPLPPSLPSSPPVSLSLPLPLSHPLSPCLSLSPALSLPLPSVMLAQLYEVNRYVIHLHCTQDNWRTTGRLPVFLSDLFSEWLSSRLTRHTLASVGNPIVCRFDRIIRIMVIISHYQLVCQSRPHTKPLFPASSWKEGVVGQRLEFECQSLSHSRALTARD